MPKLQTNFFFTILIGILILTFFIFLPYVSALILAIVLGIIFNPMHERIQTSLKGRRGLASLITLIVIITIVLTPLFFLSLQISHEARELYVHLSADGSAGFLENVSDSFANFADTVVPESLRGMISFDFDQHVRQLLDWAVNNVDALFSKAAKLLLSLFLLILALYYILKDGETMKNQIVFFSPLSDSYDELILKKLAQAVNSVIRGFLIIGIIQGILTGIGFAIFGLPNPTLWGTVAAIASLIPGLGTALVLIPGALYLIFSGDVVMGVGLILWGIFAVGLVDNFLGPRLIQRGINIHPFFILLSVIGGLALFGPIGFILGPLTLSLLFALLDIYRDYISKEKTE